MNSPHEPLFHRGLYTVAVPIRSVHVLYTYRYLWNAMLGSSYKKSNQIYESPNDSIFVTEIENIALGVTIIVCFTSNKHVSMCFQRSEYPQMHARSFLYAYETWHRPLRQRFDCHTYTTTCICIGNLLPFAGQKKQIVSI